MLHGLLEYPIRKVHVDLLIFLEFQTFLFLPGFKDVRSSKPHPTIYGSEALPSTPGNITFTAFNLLPRKLPQKPNWTQGNTGWGTASEGAAIQSRKKNTFSFCLCQFELERELISRGPWGNKRKQTLEKAGGEAVGGRIHRLQKLFSEGGGLVARETKHVGGA